MKKQKPQAPPPQERRGCDLIVATPDMKNAALVYYSFQEPEGGGKLEDIFTDYLDRKIGENMVEKP